MAQNRAPRHTISTTSVHITALDGTLNVNSLFTFAAFVGIALNPADPQNSLVSSAACSATSAAGRHFVEYHVYSFTAFLFSSLIASGLKLAIRTRGTNLEMHGGGHVNLRLLQAGIVAAAAGTIFGCAFLTAALVYLVQIKLGILGCWGWHTVAAVCPLVILVPFALFVYVFLLFYAFAR